MGNKYSFNEDFFKENSERSFYWAGFIAADGCLRFKKSKYSVLPTLEIVSADYDHLSKFMEDINTSKPIYKSKCGSSKIDGRDLIRSHISLHSQSLFDDLGNIFNVHPNKTKKHHFSSKIISHPLLRHFLRGYFDGDGGFYLNVCQNNPQMTIRVCGTIDFLKEYKKQLETGASFKSKSLPYIYNGQGALNYNGNIITRKISNYLYNDSTIYLERKYHQARSIPQHQHLDIDEDQFRELYMKYRSFTRMGRALGCSAGYIKILARKYDLIDFCKQNFKHETQIKGRYKPSKHELETALSNLQSITKVANKFNYSYDSIRNFMQEYEIRKTW